MEVFFHVYCHADYQNIIYNKLNKFRKSGLWPHISKLWIPVSGATKADWEFFSFLKNFGKKIEVFEHNNPVFNNEPDTLNFIKFRAQEVKENVPMLYLHTKGITYSHPGVKRNVNAWVRYLDLWNIAHWSDCVKALETHDCAGGFYIDHPLPHYQGNFWWANSDYIKNLITLDKENIVPLERGEFWICTGEGCKAANIGYKPEIDLYKNYYCVESDFPENF
jgi:hypothetical protein